MPPLTLLVYYTNQLNVKLNDLILKTSLQFHHLVTIIPKKLCFLLFTLQYENTISDLSTLERERDIYIQGSNTGSWASITEQAPYHILIQVTDSISLGLITQSICTNRPKLQHRTTLSLCYNSIGNICMPCYYILENQNKSVLEMPVPRLSPIGKCLWRRLEHLPRACSILFFHLQLIFLLGFSHTL